MKQNWQATLSLALLVIIGLTLWWSRWIFSYQFDSTYMNDYFDHSQWQIPLSSRVLSDSDLYQVSGWRYWHGADWFSINPEVPPLGKMLFGWSTVLTGNPYWVSIGSYFLSLGLLWAIMKQIKLTPTRRWLALILYVLMPLTVSTLHETALDSLQLLFFLLYVWLVLLIPKQSVSKKILFGFAAGASLGVFSVIKVPFFTPFILLGSAIYLYSHRSLSAIIALAIGSVAAYLGVFIPYLRTHTVQEWMTTQTWMLNFYRSGSVKHTPGMAVITTLTGWYQGWWGGEGSISAEWSWWWPLSIIGWMVLGWTTFLQRIRSTHWSPRRFLSWVKQPGPITPNHYLYGMMGLLYGVMMLIPFWPRYLLLLAPFFIIGLVRALTRHRAYSFLGLIFALAVLQFILYLHPQPQLRMEHAQRHWRDGNYQELYSMLEPSSVQLERSNFAQTLKTNLNQLQIEQTELLLEHRRALPGEQEIPVTVTTWYETRLGVTSHQTETTLKRTGHRWFLVWDWNIIAPEFTQNSNLVYEPTPLPASQLVSSDGIPMMRVGPHPHIVLHPESFPGDNTFLTEVSTFLETDTVTLLNTLFIDGRYLPTITWGPAPIRYNVEQLDSLDNTDALSVEWKPTWIPNPIITSEDGIQQAIDILRNTEQAEFRSLGKVLLVQPDGTEEVVVEHNNQQPAIIRVDQPAEAVLPAFASYSGQIVR